MSETNLPTVKELVNDLETYGKMDKLNVLLNQQPPKSWVKKHPIIKTEVINEKGQKVKVPYEYLPIDKTEYLLRKIFKSYKIEVMGVQQLFNAVQVTVRVWYKDLISGEWMFHDGVGAYQLQTEKGTSASDMANIKHGAVMMATPLAKTLAIKDACDMFGNLFGANLNRQGVKNIVVDSSLKSNEELYNELFTLFKQGTFNISEEDSMNIERIIETKEVASYLTALKLLKKNQVK